MSSKTNLMLVLIALGLVMFVGGIVYDKIICAPSAEIQKCMNLESMLPYLEYRYSRQSEMNSIVIPLQSLVTELKETAQYKEFAAKKKLSNQVSPTISLLGAVWILVPLFIILFVIDPE